MKLGLVEVLALAGLAIAWVGFKTGKLNPASRDNVVYQAVGEPGLHIADWFGGIFKSDAEKEVDMMLQKPGAATNVTVPTTKKTVTPADMPDYTTGSYYDLGVKPVPIDASAAIGRSGVLTSSEYRDQVR